MSARPIGLDDRYIYINDYEIDRTKIEQYPERTQLHLTIPYGGFEQRADVSEIPPRITHIKFEACFGLDEDKLSTLSNHAEEIIFQRLVVNRGAKKGYYDAKYFGLKLHGWLIKPPTISHLTLLRVLRFVNCKIDRLTWLPGQVELLELRECNFIEVKTKKEHLEFSLETLYKIKRVIINSCENIFAVKFPANQDHRMEALQILRHSPRLTDDVFKNFPTSLIELEIQNADITGKTIEKVGAQIEELKLEDCPNMDMTPKRATLLFPEANVQGVIEKTNITDKIQEKLERDVIGQPRAIDAAFKALCISLSGLGPSDRPSGVFLFVGPSGVGKTEMAKTIASLGGREFLRYDMGEYQHEQEVAKLMGSPPGYIGNDVGGKLTNDVQTHPNAIVLFDEIEKAHPKVHTSLLGVFDAGRLTDGKGKTVDFTQTIIIMTSNLGAGQMEALNWNHVEQALTESKNIVMRLLKQKVPPEFISRIDTIAPFRPLDVEISRNIMKAFVQNFAKNAQQRQDPQLNILQNMGEPVKREDLELTIDDNVWEHLLINFDPALGVRPIKRQYEQEMFAEIGQAVLNGLVKKGDKLHIFRENGKIEFHLMRPH